MEESFLEPMLVFCGLAQGPSGSDPDHDEPHRAGIALKAMLTPTNKAGTPSSFGLSCAWSTRPSAQRKPPAQQSPNRPRNDPARISVAETHRGRQAAPVLFDSPAMKNPASAGFSG